MKMIMAKIWTTLALLVIIMGDSSVQHRLNQKPPKREYFELVIHFSRPPVQK
jgi:hypothetical protein